MNAIDILKQQNELLVRQNERLLQVLEAFAKANKDINIVVNSYNGSSSLSTADSSNNADTKGTNITLGEDNTIG